MLLGGSAAVGAAWVAPAVLRVDSASASLFSCVDQTLAWASISGANPWTVTAVSGDVSVTAVITANTVLDLDQNGRGLGCAANSRFRDELSNLSGTGLVVTTQGNLTEVSAGVYASTLNCKTTDTENLVMTWTNGGGVTGGGFRWTAATPPGTNQRLDLQLIKVLPFSVCATIPASLTSATEAARIIGSARQSACTVSHVSSAAEPANGPIVGHGASSTT
jgi:hypothetical protein